MRSLRCGVAAALAISSLALAGDAQPDPRVELGRRLFMDPTASRTGRVSCSSCHLPEHGFSDVRAIPEDEGGPARRHSLPILDLVAEGPLHSDGEFETIDELLLSRLDPASRSRELAMAIRTRRFEEAKSKGRNPDEGAFEHALMSLRGYGDDGHGEIGASPESMPLHRRLGMDGRYDEAFRLAFGSRAITTPRVVDALKAYVLSLHSGESPFDRHLAGDAGALTEAQRRGLELFKGKAGCAACHTADAPAGGRPPFTDRRFHDTGIALRSVQPSFEGAAAVDGGAGQITFVAEDLGRFKTPSLRDAARRGPYMHDGSSKTLDEVVRFYDRGCVPHPGLDPRIAPLGLGDDERCDLVAFLGALTSDRRPGIGPSRRVRAELHVVDLSGAPLAGLPVEIRPAGDRLEGGGPDDVSRTVVTGPDGCLAFDFPHWTHVHLMSTTHEIHYDWLIPDCAPPMDVIAAPRDRIALRLRKRGDAPLPETLSPREAWGGSLPRFRLVRRIDDRTGIYATEPTQQIVPGRPAKPGTRPAQPMVVTRNFLANRRAVAFLGVTPSELSGGPCMALPSFELDLSGGWTDPVDVDP